MVGAWIEQGNGSCMVERVWKGRKLKKLNSWKKK